MEYLFLINSDPGLVPDPALDPRAFEAFMGSWLAYNARLIDGGHFVAGASLQPPFTASVVDVSTGAVTDGPFVEAKEQVGGFYLIRADDLDEALELARGIPGPAHVEVRPIAFRPDA